MLLQHISKPAQCAGRPRALSTALKHPRSAKSLCRAPFSNASVTPPRSEPRLHHLPCRLQKPHHNVGFSTISTATATTPSQNYQKNLFVKHHSHDGAESEIVLDSLLVRDSCRCRQCVDPSSQQKLFQTADIPTSIAGRINNHHSEATRTATTGTDDVERVLATISWVNDVPGYSAEHKTELTAEMLASISVSSSSPSSYLKSSSLARESERAGDTRVLWTAADMARAVQWFDYDTCMRSDETLFTVLEALRVYGLAFLRGVPDSASKENRQPTEAITVECIAERIGSLRNSFYGRSWDVRSVPGATNVAYTHQYLGLHMDLLYVKRREILHLNLMSPVRM